MTVGTGIARKPNQKDRLLPAKDRQSVDERWRPLGDRIDGVTVKELKTLPDHRGTVCEIYRPEWRIHPDPLVFVYQITVRPGQIKDWQKHLRTYARRSSTNGSRSRCEAGRAGSLACERERRRSRPAGHRRTSG